MNYVEWERIRNKIYEQLNDKVQISHNNVRKNFPEIIGYDKDNEGILHCRYDDSDHNLNAYHSMEVTVKNSKDTEACKDKIIKCLEELGYEIISSSENGYKKTLNFIRSDELKENIFYILVNGEAECQN